MISATTGRRWNTNLAPFVRSSRDGVCDDGASHEEIDP
jgi:hypothetical protein